MAEDPGIPPTAEDIRVVLTTAPPDAAPQIARALVEEGLAACVNLLPGVRSLYRWEGALQDDPETVLIVKTTEARVADLATRLRGLHPYEVPELLVLAPEAGGAAYLDWIRASVAPPALPSEDPPSSEGATA